MRENFTRWHILADHLELDQSQRQQILQHSRFPLNLPRRLAEKIPKGTLDDPILKQFLPTTAENISSQGFCSDPVGDQLAQNSSKLLKKYHARALLLTTSSCAMHCRYCFRQNFDYDTENKGFASEIALIAADPSIREVILSGGDPLSLGNDVLRALLTQLSAIGHLRHIRFHTRFPIGIPERLDEEFLSLFSSIPQRIWFIIHANHPRELDPDVLAALRRLQKADVVLLNQSVLLRGVNDDVDTLEELCLLLVDHGILPYYLHQLDRVEGAAHFEVAEGRGKALITALNARLPGYAVPKYVQERAGEPNKTPL